MTKPTKYLCAQQRLASAWASCPVWSESSLSTWRNLGSLATHFSIQLKLNRLGKLIWVFAGHTCRFVGFVMRQLKSFWSSEVTQSVDNILLSFFRINHGMKLICVIVWELFHFSHTVNLRHTSQCYTKTTAMIYGTLEPSQSPGLGRRTRDRASGRSSFNVSDSSCCCAIVWGWVQWNHCYTNLNLIKLSMWDMQVVLL